jgi:hypothetical protein
MKTSTKVILSGIAGATLVLVLIFFVIIIVSLKDAKQKAGIRKATSAQQNEAY